MRGFLPRYVIILIMKNKAQIHEIKVTYLNGRYVAYDPVSEYAWVIITDEQLDDIRLENLLEKCNI